MGDRAFTIAGPCAWNSLPYAIRHSSSQAIFKRSLKKSGASLVLHDPCRSASSVSQLLQQSEQTFRIKFVLFSWGGTKPLHRPYPITLLQNLSSEQVAMQIKYSGYWAAIHCRYVVPWSFTLRHVHHSSQYSHFLLFPKPSPLCR